MPRYTSLYFVILRYTSLYFVIPTFYIFAGINTGINSPAFT